MCSVYTTKNGRTLSSAWFMSVETGQFGFMQCSFSGKLDDPPVGVHHGRSIQSSRKKKKRFFFLRIAIFRLSATKSCTCRRGGPPSPRQPRGVCVWGAAQGGSDPALHCHVTWWMVGARGLYADEAHLFVLTATKPSFEVYWSCVPRPHCHCVSFQNAFGFINSWAPEPIKVKTHHSVQFSEWHFLRAKTKSTNLNLNLNHGENFVRQTLKSLLCSVRSSSVTMQQGSMKQELVWV